MIEKTKKKTVFLDIFFRFSLKCIRIVPPLQRLKRNIWRRSKLYRVFPGTKRCRKPKNRAVSIIIINSRRNLVSIINPFFTIGAKKSQLNEKRLCCFCVLLQKKRHANDFIQRMNELIDNLIHLRFRVQIFSKRICIHFT